MCRFIILMLLWTLVWVGCSGHFPAPSPDKAPEVIEESRFIIATAGPGDTLASLARTHLGDGDKAWKIEAFNEIDTLVPGQRVIIPRGPFVWGGISADGYQTVPVLHYPLLTERSSTNTAVNAMAFERHLESLSQNGYVTVSLDQLYAFASLKDQLPPKSIVITFDTTRRWVHKIAFPRLQKHGMKAALFIRPDKIDAKGMLTWAQIAEMANQGFDIGVKGVSTKPADRQNLKPWYGNYEKGFTAPKKSFKSRLNRPCRYFAYAKGESDDLTIAMLKKHDYYMAFTLEQGSNPFFTDNYKLKRTVINGSLDMARFLKQLKTFKSAELK